MLNSTRLPNLFFVLYFLFSISACSRVDIEMPERHQLYVDGPPQFIVSWVERKNNPKPFVAMLNGIDVTTMFTVEPGGAIADGKVIFPYLRQGDNQFVVRSPAYRVSEFTADIQGPEVHITEVNIGFPTLEVKGYLDDPSAVASFGYRDMSNYFVPVDLEENKFTAYLNYGLSGSWTFEATDVAGQIGRMPYKRFHQSGGNQSWITNALGIKVSLSGLDFAGDVAPELLDKVDIVSVIKGANPLIDTTVWPVNYKIYLNHGDAKINYLDINPALLPGYDLDIVTIASGSNLNITLCTQSVIFYEDPLCIIHANLVGVNMAAYFSVDIEASGTTVTIPDDGLYIQKINIGDIDLGNPVFNFLASIITNIATLFNDVIDTLFRVNIVGEIASDIVVPITQKILDPLLVSADVDIKPQGQEVNSMNMTARFNKIYRDGTSLVVRMNTVMDVTAPALVPDPLGIRDFGYAPVDGYDQYDFSLSISTAMINQLFDSLYRIGLFSIPIDLPGGFAFDSIRFVASPVTPPFVKVSKSDRADGALIVHDYEILIEGKEKNGGVFKELCSITINMSIPFDLIALDEDQSLGASVSNLIDFEIVTLQKGTVSLDPAVLNFLINQVEAGLVAPLTVELNKVLGHITLPSVFGLSASPRVFDADIKNGSFVVAGDLLKVD